MNLWVVLLMLHTYLFLKVKIISDLSIPIATSTSQLLNIEWVFCTFIHSFIHWLTHFLKHIDWALNARDNALYEKHFCSLYIIMKLILSKYTLIDWTSVFYLNCYKLNTHVATIQIKVSPELSTPSQHNLFYFYHKKITMNLTFIEITILTFFILWLPSLILLNIIVWFYLLLQFI